MGTENRNRLKVTGWLYALAALLIILEFCLVAESARAAMLAIAVFLPVFFLLYRYTRKIRVNIQNAARKLENYQQAILSDALITLEVNLNKDCLVYGVWKDGNGDAMPLRSILGMDVPCSYKSYIEKWCERFVDDDSKGEFLGSTSVEYLLNAYGNGKNEITFDYEAVTISGERAYLRRSICMIRDQDSGDIIAYTNVKDVSDIVRVQYRETAYISALTSDYESVDVVEINTNKEDDFITLHHRIDGEFVKLVSPEWLSERNIGKRLDIMATMVVSQDRKAFEESTKREHMVKSFDKGKIHVVDFRLARGGEEYYLQERFIPLRSREGKVIGMIACIRSIDAEIKRELGHRAELEKAKRLAEAASNAKTSFLFNMSHDIRTPMNAILGFTRIAKNHIDSREQVEESLNKIEVSGGQLLDLIDDVLEMSRIESGKFSVLEMPGDVMLALEDINPMLSSLALTKSIEYTTTYGEVHDRYVWVDTVHTNRVLINLITNAIKYTPDGGKVKVHVEQIGAAVDGKADYRFTVSDTGIGMSPEFLEHMFEEFSREQTSTVSKQQGTGLGLAIAKHITDTLGGTISATSTVGKGSTFTLTLPLRIQTEEEIEAILKNEVAAVEKTAADLKGRRVLLVEDNELNREIARDILEEEEGLAVEDAEDGQIAVEMVKKNGVDYYDFILMDIQMPVMNGYEATQQIRALPNGNVVPIIALSANAFTEDVERSLAAGMNAHIAKPIKPDVLMDTLADVMR